MLFARIAALHEGMARALEPHLAEMGISWANFQLLAAVAGMKTASQSDISQALGISPATLSEAVQTQVQRGLLEQVPAPRDRRAKRLRLTSEGSEAMRKIRRLIRQLDDQLIRDLSPNDQARFAAILDGLLEKLQQES